MGTSTRGLIGGLPSMGTIESVVCRHLSDHGSLDSSRGHEEGTYRLEFVVDGYPVNLWVWHGQSFPDEDFPFEGPSVFLSMGCGPNSVALVERLVAEFGGFVDDKDSDEWRRVEMLSLETESPAKKFDQALDRLLTASQARVIRGLAHDGERLDALMGAIADYRSLIEAEPEAPSP